MRVALLPTRGDPFGMRLVFHFFENIWADEVDKLFILVNSTIETEVVDYIKKFTTHPKVTFRCINHPMDHGPALTEMFKHSGEETVVFYEDDAIIFKKGLVDQYCKYIEAGAFDCVGSLRWSCSGNVIDRVRQYFNLWDDKYLVGGHYWPCFFFARRSDIAKTELNFKGNNFKAGEYIKPLQWTTGEDVSTDTFCYFSWEMRALGLKFLDVEQYHGNSGDLQAYETKSFLFDGTCGWLHNGTLSSAIEDILTNEKNIPLAYRKREGMPETKYERMPAEKEEMERRLSWHKLAFDGFKDKCDEIAEFRDLYGKAIEKYINIFNLDRNRIEKSIRVYKELIGL